METKLTLRLSKRVIDRAKDYAKKRNTSLSRMIEAYLDSISKEAEDSDEQHITPFVKSLSGVVDLPADFDPKQTYGELLDKKHA